jgi:hypothetical protein
MGTHLNLHSMAHSEESEKVGNGWVGSNSGHEFLIHVGTCHGAQSWIMC